MTIRTYRVQIGGTITVDDTTLRSAVLAFKPLSGPGDARSVHLTDEERGVVDSLLLEIAGSSDPVRLMQAYLVGGHYTPLEAPVRRRLEHDLPGVQYTTDGIRVVDVVTHDET